MIFTEGLTMTTKRDIGAEILEGLTAYKDRPETLKRYKIDSPNVKLIRDDLGMTQGEFALFLSISVRTLEKWEQGTRNPDGAANTLLRVIEKEPTAVMRALHA
ncbi:MAG: helix-turn-helix domain-containing protein [Proteobacteria bacterium]|nr:helix-turn-helix domain-containing protein [Pseudomonadota bacterium]